MSLVKSYKDSCSIEIPVSALSQKRYNEYLEGSFCPIIEIDGLQWWVVCVPAGDSVENAGYVSVYVAVSKAVDGRYTLSVKNSDIKSRTDMRRFRSHALPRVSETNRYQFDDRESFGWNQFVSHKVLLGSGGIKDGIFTLVCDVEFVIPMGDAPPVPRVTSLFVVNREEVTLSANKGSYRINKAFLANISPTFNAMFVNDPENVEIRDFDIGTVSKALNFCQGIALGGASVGVFIEMLRFGLKYEITGLVKHIESWLIRTMNPDTVSEVAAFAWKFARKDLQDQCARCFYSNRNDLTINPEFVNMDPAIIQGLLQTALIIDS
uniref:BTB domain-containing protein n=1 Tax=Panagrellus redivivus TaxID=6233 RepID=A0A7E4V7C5_PANRE